MLIEWSHILVSTRRKGLYTPTTILKSKLFAEALSSAFWSFIQEMIAIKSMSKRGITDFIC